MTKGKIYATRKIDIEFPRPVAKKPLGVLRSRRASVSGERTSGVVKFFNADKGFGFISRPNAKDVFVHASAIPPDTELDEGDRVSFELVEGAKGLKAEDVKREI